MPACRRCHLPKPDRQFYLKVSRGYEYRDKICIECKGKRQTALDRLRRTGFSPELFDRLLLNQNGCCAICQDSTTLVADHSHTSGKTRGLLCNRCNRVLGLVVEDALILQSMIGYILEHTEVINNETSVGRC